MNVEQHGKKASWWTASLLLIIAALFASPFEGVVAGDRQDSNLAESFRDLSKLTLVTKTPHKMLDFTAILCRRPLTGHNLHEGFKEPAYCNVYVNVQAKSPMLSGLGKYPVGSLIVKSKLLQRDSTNIEFFTVMRKMDDNYDRKNGNWEYSIVDGRSSRVISRGRIESCIECHTDYRKTDFVTRRYLAETH